MKFESILLTCYITYIIPTLAAKSVLLSKESLPELDTKSDEEIAEAEAAADEHVIEESNEVESEEPTDHHVKKKHPHNKTAEATLDELKDMLKNLTETSNITSSEEEIETTTPYNVKHYLTAEQKYYMLRINLLGIGIRVVHDIIPIPVLNTDQYKKSMEALLDKVQAARVASSNVTAGKMHNITLEDAHKLQLKMTHAGSTVAPAASKATHISRTTEAMILVGVVVGIVLIGGLLYACKRSMDGRGDYYDHLQGGGGAVPLN